MASYGIGYPGLQAWAHRRAGGPLTLAAITPIGHCVQPAHGIGGERPVLFVADIICAPRRVQVRAGVEETG
jgi:hypothetical protein